MQEVGSLLMALAVGAVIGMQIQRRRQPAGAPVCAPASEGAPVAALARTANIAAAPAEPARPADRDEPPPPTAPDASPQTRAERRLYPRLVVDEPMLVTPFAGGETMAEVCDVSLGGIRFRIVGLPVRADDVLRVRFNVGGDSVAGVARVLRTSTLDEHTTEVSAEFSRVDPWAARRLEQALQRRGD